MVLWMVLEIVTMERIKLKLNKSMNKYNNLLIITLLILSFIGLYFVSTEETNKYFKSIGYVLIGIGVTGVTLLKRNKIHQSNK